MKKINDILFATNGHSFNYLILALDSFFKHNKYFVKIHICYGELTEKMLDLLKRRYFNENVEFFLYNIEKDMVKLSDFMKINPVSAVLKTPYTFSYFLGLDILNKKGIKKVLVLDADLFFRGSIEEILSLNIGMKKVGAVQEKFLTDFHKKYTSSESYKGHKWRMENLINKMDVDLINQKYFNSGVMIIKLNKICRNGFTFEKYMYESIQTHGKFLSHTYQDLMNKKFINKYSSIENKWNYCFFTSDNPNWNESTVNEIEYKKSLIFHFAGPNNKLKNENKKFLPIETHILIKEIAKIDELIN